MGPHAPRPGPGSRYRLIVESGSTAVVAGPELMAEDRKPVVFPPIFAERLRVVEGTVVDGSGRPIPGPP